MGVLVIQVTIPSTMASATLYSTQLHVTPAVPGIIDNMSTSVLPVTGMPLAGDHICIQAASICRILQLPSMVNTKQLHHAKS